MTVNKIITDTALGESYRVIKHKSGLTIMVLTKQGYESTHAIFATKYGSIDTSILRENGGFETIPEGTAHFLEHKLFESEDLDAFERFAKTGAYANAFTSFDMTGYLFSCSDNFKENLEILLDFVQSPYFTEETVQKEQGIIGQEIRMYKDSAGWEAMFNMLRTMYEKHPVRIDIAGTEKSISCITAEMLYDCYRNFYDLSNMVLAVAGKATVEEVLEVADRMLKNSGGKRAVREFKKESPKPVCDYVEESLPIKVPIFVLGFKEDFENPERTLKQVVSTEIIHEIIAGRSSPLYNRLLEESLVNNSFSNEYFYGFGYACSMFSGESTDPEKASAEIRKEILSRKLNGVSEKDFERARRKLYGRMVMGFNDIESIAHDMVKSDFDGYGIFDASEICRTLTLDDINERLGEILCDDYTVLSVVKPLE